MMTLLPLALVSLLAAQTTTVTAAAGWDCKTPLQLGKQSFDLSSLAGEHHFEVSTPTPPTITKTSYRLSLCSPLSLIPSTPAADQCPQDTNLCMTTISTREGLEDRVISVVPVVQKLAEGTPEVEQGDGGWWLALGGGEYNTVRQKARVEMLCDAAAKETVPTFTSYDPLTGLLTLKWTTAAACDTTEGGTPTPPPPKDDDKDKPKEGEEKNPRAEGGMGFFGWFFTLLILFFLSYLILGSWHNYTQYGATGVDAIPHKELWRDLPWLVKDLVKGECSLLSYFLGKEEERKWMLTFGF
ncbi:autophagy-related protein 27 [Leucosporidium creatinivorum]|uniref:Autophagy-related protein 27 n=1 Tax=Leucosporidium creatinivorum TaxID=106004 RepID=A0A1Y2G3V1_9BASI|nr:autophagy-related protein 27 [Leucosporidium creatinivorum]